MKSILIILAVWLIGRFIGKPGPGTLSVVLDVCIFFTLVFQAILASENLLDRDGHRW